MIKLSAMSSLHQRIISAIILAPLVLGIVYTGGMFFDILLIIAAITMYWEWFNMTKKSQYKYIWWFVGLFYIIIPCISLAYIMSFGNEMIFLLLFFIWAVDIGAYFAGKTIGGAKIAPKISPNKTWAGLFGAMVASSLVLIIASKQIDFFSNIEISYLIIAACFLSIIAQAGDFFESWVKRKFAVKDSSNIIPGHGGLLDRLDGLLFIAPTVIIMIVFWAYSYGL